MPAEFHVARLTAGGIAVAGAAIAPYEKLGTREDVLHFDIPPA